MVRLDIFVSCGTEVSDLRDIAVRVVEALDRAFYSGLEIEIVIRPGDYRDWAPEVVPSGELAARSLRQVERSTAVIGILGASVPALTSKELTRAAEGVAAGSSDQVWLFLRSASKAEVHRRFLTRVRQETKMQLVYQEFNDDVDFQEKLFVALIPYVVKKSILERQTVVESSVGAIA